MSLQTSRRLGPTIVGGALGELALAEGAGGAPGGDTLLRAAKCLLLVVAVVLAPDLLVGEDSSVTPGQDHVGGRGGGGGGRQGGGEGGGEG